MMGIEWELPYDADNLGFSLIPKQLTLRLSQGILKLLQHRMKFFLLQFFQPLTAVWGRVKFFKDRKGETSLCHNYHKRKENSKLMVSYQ